MKPSFTLWRFSNPSLYLSRKRHDRAHVHLVEGGEHGGGVLGLLRALGDAAAQPRHRRALFALGQRARHVGLGRRAAGAAGRAARCAGAAAGAGFALKSITSALVTRPSLPVPGTSAGLMPASAVILRTAGPLRSSFAAARRRAATGTTAPAAWRARARPSGRSRWRRGFR